RALGLGRGFFRNLCFFGQCGSKLGNDGIDSIGLLAACALGLGRFSGSFDFRLDHARVCFRHGGFHRSVDCYVCCFSFRERFVLSGFRSVFVIGLGAFLTTTASTPAATAATAALARAFTILGVNLGRCFLTFFGVGDLLAGGILG